MINFPTGPNQCTDSFTA